MDSVTPVAHENQQKSTTRWKMLFLLVPLLIVAVNMHHGFSFNDRDKMPAASHKYQKVVHIQPYSCRIFSKAAKKSLSVVAKRPPWFDHMDDSSARNSSERVYYLTTGNGGRLGNQLFGYASLFGIAWRSSRRIPLWNNDGQGLRTLFSQLRIPQNHNSSYRKDRFDTIHENYPRLSLLMNKTEPKPISNVHINGYLQDVRYFGHVEDHLRYDFTFSSEIMKEAHSWLDSVNASLLRDEGFVRVVIHVRLGDLMNHAEKELVRTSDQYVNRAMTYFTSCFPKVHFIVASDDIGWCRQNIDTLGRRVDFIERSREVTLALASLSDHAIINLGSFGWWVSWFANGITLVPSQDASKTRRPPVRKLALTI